MLAVHWFDKRNVFVWKIEIRDSWIDDSLLKPTAINKYKKFMVEVDHSDQLHSRYSIERRSKN